MSDDAHHASGYDLFLSYSRTDALAVHRVRQLLNQWDPNILDSQDLTAGLPWPQALEEALLSARAVAVFIGTRRVRFLAATGGAYFALIDRLGRRRKERKFPVIPVLLDGVISSPVSVIEHLG